LFDSIPPPIGVDLVFFDGEDGGDYGASPGEWCQGSFYFASHLPERYKWAINVDMIGDKDLSILIEGNSFRLAPELVERVWKKAEELNETAFAHARGYDVFDDHMPLLMKGIPAIDIIDFDYPHWHTTTDTADKCAAASLTTVGRVLVAVIYDL
jgi:Zn-dependent M28 family amino/carboxypeptidase